MDERLLIAGGLLLLLAGAWWFTDGFNFGAQSIVSVSDITVNLGAQTDEVIQANVVINNNDSLWFIANDIRSASNGQFSSVLKDVRANFSSGGVFCNVPLRQGIFKTNLGFTDNVYYEAGSSYSKDVISTVSVERANYASGTFDQLVGSITFNACKGVTDSCSFEHTPQQSVVFTTTDLGKVKIENLGNLDNGKECPNEGAFVLVPSSSGLKIVDRTLWLSTQAQTSLFNCLPIIGNPFNCVDTFLNNNANSFPVGYSTCDPRVVSCSENVVYPLRQDKFVYHLPSGAFASIIINMNKEFVGAIIFQPAVVKPVIESINMNPIEVTVGQQATLTVNVRNSGQAGTVRVVVTPQSGRVSVVPTEATKTIGANGIGTYSFVVNGLIDGGDTFSIFAEGGGADSLDDTETFSITVKPAQGGSCGDGFCQLGEQLTCPQDCQVQTHLACSQNACVQIVGAGDNQCQSTNDCLQQAPLTCAPWENKVLVNQTTYLIDIFGFKLFPLTTVAVPTCQFNWGLLAIVVIAVGLIYGAYKVVTEK